MSKQYYIKNKSKGKGLIVIGIIMIIIGIYNVEQEWLLSGGILFAIGKMINWWHN